MREGDHRNEEPWGYAARSGRDDSGLDDGGPRNPGHGRAAWALGLNWYLNQNIKLVLDYEQTEFEAGGGGTAKALRDREEEKGVLSRQVDAIPRAAVETRGGYTRSWLQLYF